MVHASLQRRYSTLEAKNDRRIKKQAASRSRLLFGEVSVARRLDVVSGAVRGDLLAQGFALGDGGGGRVLEAGGEGVAGAIERGQHLVGRRQGLLAQRRHQGVLPALRPIVDVLGNLEQHLVG